MLKYCRLLINVATSSNFKKVIASLWLIGIKATTQRVMMKLKANIKYSIWLKNKIADAKQLNMQKKARFDYEPLISVITPAFNTPEKFLRSMIKSIHTGHGCQ